MSPVLKKTSSLARETKWHGNHGGTESYRRLRAGDLSLVYEKGNLRYVSIGSHEVIRMIYCALRDQEWLTIEPVISGEEYEIEASSFRIKYNIHFISGDIDFSSRCQIEGKSDNSLVFSFEGEALNTFMKNRIGFCVLHPAEEYAGESCIITHSNDLEELSEFPSYISPNQSFLDIESMKWRISGFDCSLNFFGDVFETEDQRNWTDGSYKTYCTPLYRPFPVRIEKGSRISQRVEFKAEVKAEVKIEKSDSRPVLITLYPEKMPGLPAIGIGRSTRQVPLTDLEIRILRKLRFDHYRIDLYLFNTEWKLTGEIALRESERLGYKIEMALFFDDDAEDQISDFICWIPDSHPEIAVIDLYHKTIQSTPDVIAYKIVPLLRNKLPSTRIAYGTNANFAQLNRNRPESNYADYLCYAIHPQEHASDNATLVENLQPQGNTVESALEFAAGKGIWISPVNIQRRFNANIENYEQAAIHIDFPPQADSRMMSLFGACWTTGSLKYLSEAGADGITYFETVGERGIIQGENDSNWPEKFPSAKGMIFPVFHLFYYLLRNKSFKVLQSSSSHPLEIDILALSDGQKVKIIIVNFTSEHDDVSISGAFKLISLQQINSGNFEDASIYPEWIENTPKTEIRPDKKVLLEPFSISFIEGIL